MGFGESFFAYFGQNVTLKDRETFRRIVLKSAFRKRRMYEEFLDGVSLLKDLEVGVIFFGIFGIFSWFFFSRMRE